MPQKITERGLEKHLGKNILMEDKTLIFPDKKFFHKGILCKEYDDGGEERYSFKTFKEYKYDINKRPPLRISSKGLDLIIIEAEMKEDSNPGTINFSSIQHIKDYEIIWINVKTSNGDSTYRPYIVSLE
jgi:hypothetical protein